MKRVMLSVIITLLFLVGVGVAQGPLTNAFNLRVKTDSNGYLMMTGGGAGTAGPLTNLGNLRMRTDSNGYLMVTIAAGTITPDIVQPNAFVFANIGTVLTANGQIGYCSDCTIANPCASGGTGAIAKRLNGVNVCN